MPGGYIYILGSHTGTLYIGVTSNLYRRVMQHKEGTLVSLRPTAASACSILKPTKTFAHPSLGKNRDCTA
jgi:predicted GIY-YIG superfamily endonuclease